MRRLLVCYSSPPHPVTLSPSPPFHPSTFPPFHPSTLPPFHPLARCDTRHEALSPLISLTEQPIPLPAAFPPSTNPFTARHWRSSIQIPDRVGLLLLSRARIAVADSLQVTSFVERTLPIALTDSRSCQTKRHFSHSFGTLGSDQNSRSHRWFSHLSVTELSHSPWAVWHFDAGEQGASFSTNYASSCTHSPRRSALAASQA
jgi:hypothetical protein